MLSWCICIKEKTERVVVFSYSPKQPPPPFPRRACLRCLDRIHCLPGKTFKLKQEIISYISPVQALIVYFQNRTRPSFDFDVHTPMYAFLWISFAFRFDGDTRWWYVSPVPSHFISLLNRHRDNLSVRVCTSRTERGTKRWRLYAQKGREYLRFSHHGPDSRTSIPGIG